jgi:secondary thiamine-phosphate synthase enzyme
MRINHAIVSIDTDTGISIHDITPRIREYLRHHGVVNGFIIVSTRHTTTALTVNEAEERLLDDMKLFLEKLAPRDGRYRHNDIHLRDCPPDEPENAHAHLAAMLLNSTEVIPVIGGELALGTWQSVLFLELDGPKRRSVTIQLCGE